jgi:hypothetical protein
VYVTIVNFLSDVVILTFITFLATALPPILAAIVAVIANEGAIHMLREIVSAGQDSHGSIGLSILDGVLYVIYIMLPSYGLLNGRTGVIDKTWRVQATDWTSLLLSAGYTVAIITLFYLLTIAVLRRKSLG